MKKSSSRSCGSGAVRETIFNGVALVFLLSFFDYLSWVMKQPSGCAMGVYQSTLQSEVKNPGIEFLVSRAPPLISCLRY